MRARCFALLALALAAGCVDLDLDDLECGPGGACPEGHHCVAATNRCAPGAGEDLGAGVSDDLGSDDAGDDAGGGRLPNGAACAAPGDCASSLCVDGVCCDQACDGQCQACDVTPGSCTQVTSGQPHGARAACTGAGGTCGGACGSSPTACDYPATTTSCRAHGCTDSVETMAATCDGKGACPPAQTTSCGAFKCNGASCYTSCTAGNSECVAPAVCISGVCMGQLANGLACTGNGDCKSGFCFDGYCCNGSCTGQCQACDVTPGQCLQVSGAPRNGRAACNSAGTTCGGQCGSKLTSCDYPTSQCRPQSCSGSTETFAANCDGNGACPAAQTKSCSPFVCGGNACQTSCTGDGDCVSGDYCNGSSGCLATKPLGRACGSAGECTSGFCADGVCCNGACNNNCERCSAGGTCSAVPSGSAPAHGACTSDSSVGAVCSGYCDGSNHGCTYPGGSVSCRYCGIVTQVMGSPPHPVPVGYAGELGTCNGQGACANATATNCGTYACSTSGTCYMSCSDSSQCDGLSPIVRTCVNHVCM